jgi:hypothetical protein
MIYFGLMETRKSYDDSLWLPKGFKHRQKYLCLWQDDEGKILGLPTGEFLCAESFTKGDKLVEEKMRQAARHYGVDTGSPIWHKGRKVSAMEADDQMERLLDGKIPDEQEEVLVDLEEDYLRSRGQIHDK